MCILDDAFPLLRTFQWLPMALSGTMFPRLAKGQIAPNPLVSQSSSPIFSLCSPNPLCWLLNILFTLLSLGLYNSSLKYSLTKPHKIESHKLTQFGRQLCPFPLILLIFVRGTSRHWLYYTIAFHWSVINIRCYISFSCTTKWFNNPIHYSGLIKISILLVPFNYFPQIIYLFIFIFTVPSKMKDLQGQGLWLFVYCYM